MVVVTVAWALLMGIDAFAGFQRRAADTFFPSAVRDPETVVIGIDNKSLRAVGPLPWRRSVHAELARRLADSGVRTAVWDVIFGGEGVNPADNADFASALGELNGPVLGEQITTRPSRVDPTLLDATVEAGPLDVLVERHRRGRRPRGGDARSVGRRRAHLAGGRQSERRARPGARGRGAAFGARRVRARSCCDPTRCRRAGGSSRPRAAMRCASTGRRGSTGSASLRSCRRSTSSRGAIDPSRLRGKVVVIGAVEPTLGRQPARARRQVGRAAGRDDPRERHEHDAHRVLPRAGDRRGDDDLGRAAHAGDRAGGAVPAGLVRAHRRRARAAPEWRVRPGRVHPVRRRAHPEQLVVPDRRAPSGVRRRARRSVHHRDASTTARLIAVRAVRTGDGCTRARGVGPASTRTSTASDSTPASSSATCAASPRCRRRSSRPRCERC